VPGIAGIVSRRRADECQRLVQSMIGSMAHEKFYVSGTRFAPDMGVYAGWVAIESSLAANQVFLSENKNIALLLSGECFLDPGKLAELKHHGHRFTAKPGDWMVHFYEEEGERFFEKLNGLFNGLLIDTTKRRAFLFNDRYGVERIYYHESKDEVFFASEAKALLRVLPELRALDEQGVAQYLAFGCNLDWRTLFKGVRVLPGGSLWTFEHGNCRKTSYFSPTAWESQPPLSVESFEAEFQKTFKRVLPPYFESELGVGISLTGGLDSRMIMACRPQNGNRPICHTFSGEKTDTLDARLGASVAGACGLEHKVIRIAPDFFSDFASHADRTVYITDGCFGILGAHEIYLNAQAGQLARVRLTGNYGSEVLRAVSGFKPIGIARNLFNSEIRQSINLLKQNSPRSTVHPVTSAAFREIPWKLFGNVSAGRSQVIFRTPYLDNEVVALACRAPESLSRSPLPAIHLVQNSNPALGRISTDQGLIGETGQMTRSLKRLYSAVTFKLDHLQNDDLPHGLSVLDPLFEHLNSKANFLGLHKFLHYRSWFRKELAQYVTEVLTDVRTRQSPLWNPDFLARMAEAHIVGYKNYTHEIGIVLTLEAVQRLIIKAPGINNS
jgi:asparagine synthase (glutamine-hydrolysing)